MPTDLSMISPYFQAVIGFLRTSQNPQVSPYLTHIFVLSATNTVLGKLFDINRESTEHDKHDDLRRVLLGLDTAIQSVANKLGKKVTELTKFEIAAYAPQIIYNGSDKNGNTPGRKSEISQNDDLKELIFALEEQVAGYVPDSIKSEFPNLFADSQLFYIVRHRIKILHNQPNEHHTLGQFKSLARYLERAKQQPVLSIVTDCWHAPRTASYCYLLPSMVQVAQCRLVNRDLEEVCNVQLKLEGEARRMVEYAKRGDISFAPHPALFNLYQTTSSLLHPNGSESIKISRLNYK